MMNIAIAAYATHDGMASPELVTVDFNSETLARLKKLKWLCQKHDLVQVREAFDIDWGELDCGLTMLVVTFGHFWFEGYPSHAPGHLETRMCRIEAVDYLVTCNEEHAVLTA